MLAELRGDRPTREVGREHGNSETLYCGWRKKLLEAGREALAGKEEPGRAATAAQARLAGAGARSHDL